MSDRFIIKKESIHELSRMSYMLYKAFNQMDKTLVDSEDTLTSNCELDYSLRPQDYYSFRFGLKKCSIHKFRNKHFTLICEGFTPTCVKSLSELNVNYKLYSGMYGYFSDFGDALNSFADVVHEMSQICLRSLF